MKNATPQKEEIIMSKKNGKTEVITLPEVTTPEVTTPEVTTPEVEVNQEAMAARRAAMELLGINEDDIAAAEEKKTAKRLEESKSKLEVSANIAGLRKEIERFGSPVRVVVEGSGIADQTATLRITFPKSGSKTANMGTGNGSRGKACRVNGVEYPTCQAACTEHGLDTAGNSAKRVLDAAKNHGKIESFELVNA